MPLGKALVFDLVNLVVRTNRSLAVNPRKEGQVELQQSAPD
jgi:hypothetical protein